MSGKNISYYVCVVSYVPALTKLTAMAVVSRLKLTKLEALAEAMKPKLQVY